MKKVMKKLWFIFVLWIGKILSIVINVVDKKRGTNFSGKIANYLFKDFIIYFTNIDYSKVIFITGTNGKSTTTNLIAHTLQSSGTKIATNKEGANMLGGVTTTLIKNSNLLGKFNKEFLVLEIDERSLEGIYRVLPAQNLCITNLQKDQVQRNGDPDFIYRKFSNVINKKMTLFLNNEEPRSKGLEDFAGKSIYYSVEKNIQSFEKDDFYTVTLPCPKCNNKIKYNYYNIESIGNFECVNCAHKSNPNPDVLVTNIDFDKKEFMCNHKTYKITYTTPFYIYNYGLCIAICNYFNIGYNDIQKAFDTFINPANRGESFKYKNKNIKYLRIKQENPETFQNALNIVASDKTDKALFIGLYEIKDFEPAYTNTFYFFDCDFANVINSNVEKYVCFSKTVCYDCANRIIYEGVPKDKIDILNIEDDFDTIFKCLDDIKTDTIYIITGMKPYKKIKEFFKNSKGDNNE